MTIITGNTYALLVAVENYNHGQFTKVNYASKDAKDLSTTLTTIGVSDITSLIDKDATYVAINSEIKRLSNRATKYDRIIVFFAGHGTYQNDENRIIPVDAYPNSIKDTTITISSILGHLKNSQSKKNIIFFDCCHSGYEPGENIRDLNDPFLADELLYNYRNAEYCCGFAASKSNQKSISDHSLKNGVWSHYLIKALSGDADQKVYESGILFSDKLQAYLSREVSEFVKMHDEKKRDQNPIIFGNQTDRFPIADLNEIFDRRTESKRVLEISFVNVTILIKGGGTVQSLPGFQKGYHKVPTSNYSGADSFVKTCGSKLIEDEISELEEDLKAKLKYKRKQIEVQSSNGSGSIVTPDFTFSLEILQSDSNPSEYILLRKLENFQNGDIVLTEDFNYIFSNSFDTLELQLSRGTNIEDLIDRIEDLNDDKIKLSYNSKKPSVCRISIEGLFDEICITKSSISIISNVMTSPEKLVSNYKKAHNWLLAKPELKLLN